MVKMCISLGMSAYKLFTTNIHPGKSAHSRIRNDSKPNCHVPHVKRNDGRPSKRHRLAYNVLSLAFCANRRLMHRHCVGICHGCPHLVLVDCVYIVGRKERW